MAIRVRKDGSMWCAALTSEEDGDTYIDDGLHYEMSVVKGVIVALPSPVHELHPRWWWTSEAPRGADRSMVPETPKGWKWALVPDYPEGEVVGPCICGSWPGGVCLRCPPLKSDGAVLGRRGGEARAKKLSPERRSEIARKAARARWGKS